MSQLRAVFSERMKIVHELVERTNKSSVLIIQQFPIREDTVTKYPKIRESISNILAFVELGNEDVLQEIIALADGVFDHIVCDSDIKLPVSETLVRIAKRTIKQSKLFFYSDINVWADSAIQFILQQEEGILDKQIMLTGEGLLREAISHRLNYFGGSVVEDPSASIDILIGCQLKGVSVTESILKRLNSKANLYDTGIGNFPISLIEAASLVGHPIYRIDIRAGISSLVIKILETDYLRHKIMGRTHIKGIELVAGGIMGRKDAIVIDDINYPENIIGIADGQGNFKVDMDAEDHERLAFVTRLIEKV